MVDGGRLESDAGLDGGVDVPFLRLRAHGQRSRRGEPGARRGKQRQ